MKMIYFQLNHLMKNNTQRDGLIMHFVTVSWRVFHSNIEYGSYLINIYITKVVSCSTLYMPVIMRQWVIQRCGSGWYKDVTEDDIKMWQWVIWRRDSGWYKDVAVDDIKCDNGWYKDVAVDNIKMLRHIKKNNKDTPNHIIRSSSLSRPAYVDIGVLGLIQKKYIVDKLLAYILTQARLISISSPKVKRVIWIRLLTITI